MGKTLTDKEFAKLDGLVWWLARHSPLGAYDPEEAHAVALLGLAKALKTYDPSRGASFSTHATNKIRWELGDECRRRWGRQGQKEKNDAKVFSFEVMQDMYPNWDMEDPEAQEEFHKIEIHEEQQGRVDSLAEVLRPREREIFRLIAQGYTQQKISEIFGVSASRMGQIVRRARKRIREAA